MTEPFAAGARRRRYFWILVALFFLFIFRVVGQVLVAFGGVRWLPPLKEWFSGLLPYPGLLASQILIIILFTRICVDFARGRGYFVAPKRRFGINVMVFGWIYLGAMIVRYLLRMTLHVDQRWFGGSIPIFFHWVLASFVLVLGSYHVKSPLRPQR